MAAWPGTLPTHFLVDSLQFSRQPRSDSNPTDVGPTISRQRFTAASQFFTGDMNMTPAQYATLEAFYESTLFGASMPFDWVHPTTGVAKVMRFDLKTEQHFYISRIILPTKWVISMAFEILP